MPEDQRHSSDIAPDERGSVPVAQQDPKTRKSFARIKLELSDDELSSPGVQKMLVEELGRTQELLASMEEYREKFYKVDKELAVEKEKGKKNLAFELISGGCLAVGAAVFGYAPSLTTLPLAGWMAVTAGAVLTLIGIGAKAIMLK